MLCENCNTQVQEGADFCPECGAKTTSRVVLPKEAKAESIDAVFAEEDEAVEREANRRMKKIGIGVLSGLLLLNIVGVTAFVLTRQASADNRTPKSSQIDLGSGELLDTEYEAQILAYEEAIEIEPNNAENYEKLADLYVELGEEQKADEVLSRGIEQTGSDQLKDRRSELTIVDNGDINAVKEKPSGTDTKSDTKSGSTKSADADTSSGKNDKSGKDTPKNNGNSNKKDPVTPVETEPETKKETEPETETQAPVSEIVRYSAFVSTLDVAESRVEEKVAEQPSASPTVPEKAAAEGMAGAYVADINPGTEVKDLVVSQMSYETGAIGTLGVSVYTIQEEEPVAVVENAVKAVVGNVETEYDSMEEMQVVLSEKAGKTYLSVIQSATAAEAEGDYTRETSYRVYSFENEQLKEEVTVTETGAEIVKVAQKPDSKADVNAETEKETAAEAKEWKAADEEQSCKEYMKTLLDEFGLYTKNIEEYYAWLESLEDGADLEKIKERSIFKADAQEQAAELIVLTGVETKVSGDTKVLHISDMAEIKSE